MLKQEVWGTSVEEKAEMPSAVLLYILSCDRCASFSGFLSLHVLLGQLHAHLFSTQEALNGVLWPTKDVRRDQAELAAGEGHVVRRRVLPLAHRQQWDLPPVCAGMWRPRSRRKKLLCSLIQAVGGAVLAVSSLYRFLEHFKCPFTPGAWNNFL